MDISTTSRWLSSRDTHQQNKQQTDDQSCHKEYNGGCHSRSKVECGTSKHVVIRERCHALHLVAAQYIEEIEHAQGSEREQECHKRRGFPDVSDDGGGNDATIRL